MIVHPEKFDMLRSRVKQMQLAADYPCTINCQHLRAALFLKRDNALCCITKHVMPKCWSQFEGMRDFWINALTKVFRLNQKFRKVVKCTMSVPPRG